MAFLCISLNNSSVDAVHILDGELNDIDKYTTNHNNTKSILKEFPEKIQELKNRYNLENTDANIKVRIFLNNDKEQIIMYRKHVIVFKLLLKNIEFLKYAVTYDNTIFSKKEREKILDENTTDKEVIELVKRYVSNMDQDEYYSLIRKLCTQYTIYLEDYEEEGFPTIDELYADYVENLKNTESLPKVNIVQQKQEQKSPFAVFEHPNFSKIYGRILNKEKPIFILGGKTTEDTKLEYTEIYENTKKCFSNQIYYPLNSNVSLPMNEDFVSVFLKSLLVIINGNEYNDILASKINYASNNNITVLILVSDDNLKEIFENKFGLKETVIIKKYVYGDYKSQKEFADIMVGLYINEYKKLKVAQ